MTDAEGRVDAPSRQTTGVRGLDRVLGGGLIRGATYALVGCPGSGKTVLASQMAFAAARAGGTVLYVSVLSEPQSRLLANLSTFEFFAPDLVGSNLKYVSAVSALDGAESLERVEELLCDEIRRVRPSLVVIDAMGGLAACASSTLEYRRFLRQVSGCSAVVSTTMLLLVEERPEPTGVEQQVADGVLDLRQPSCGMRGWRELSVQKHRGSAALPGSHVYEIDERGVVVHPRLEAIGVRNALPVTPGRSKVGFGIEGLDDMLQGGVSSGSVTALVGEPGSGKTVLGVSFLAAGLRLGEPGVYFGLYEAPDRVLAKMAGIGVELDRAVGDGALSLFWRPPTEQILDEVAEQILDALDATGARRLFLDGADGLMQGAAHPARFPLFFAALTNELRARGVTTTVSMEGSRGGALAPVVLSLSAAVDNIIHSRYVVVRSRTHRLLSILKVREDGYDASVREFRIGATGVVVAWTSESAEEVLADRATAGERSDAAAPTPSAPTGDPDRGTS